MKLLLLLFLSFSLVSCATNSAETTSASDKTVQTGDIAADFSKERRESIRRQVFENLKSIRKCYNSLGTLKPGAKGKIVASWDIGEDGKVLAVRWKEFDPSLELMRDCMTRVLSSIEYKNAGQPNQVIVVEAYPFIFAEDPKAAKK